MLHLFGFSPAKKSSTANEQAAAEFCTARILSFLSTNELITTGQLVSHQWKDFIDKTFAEPINTLLVHTTMGPFFKAQPTDRQLTSVKLLPGGLTNKTLLITTADKRKFVARHPGAGSGLFVDRVRESGNVRIAASLGVTPEVLFENPQGSRITQFLDQPLPMSSELLKVEENIYHVVAVMKKTHTSSQRFENDINVFDRNRVMLKILADKHTSLPDDYTYAITMINQIEDTIKEMPVTTAPCHNDTTPGNFILSNGKMYLIDLEYSGNNDPLWDLVNLSMEAEFNKEQDQLLLEAYYDKVDEETLTRFNLYKPVVEYWVALWAQVQISNRNYADGLETLQRMERKRFLNCLGLLEGIVSPNPRGPSL